MFKVSGYKLEVTTLYSSPLARENDNKENTHKIKAFTQKILLRDTGWSPQL